jgi:hypothetical protein
MARASNLFPRAAFVFTGTMAFLVRPQPAKSFFRL